MQINLLNAEEEQIEFLYYTAEGVYLGRSEGTTPDEHLFNQAHYVFDSNSDIIKNLDILAASRKKLVALRKKLIAVPIKDMVKIMELNQQIEALEYNITELEKSVSHSRAS